MKFLDYNGETLALCLARPDWDHTMTVEVDLTRMVHIEQALSHEESRELFGASARYSFSYKPFFLGARESTDFRLWLNRLKDELVAVPLWQDGVELTNPVNAGGTNLPIRDQPVRSGAEWIVLNDDATVSEIVVVDDVSGGAVHLANGLQNNWAARTLLYPLLFGRFATRPEIESVTDEDSEAELKFQENSPFARKLNPFPGDIPVVGVNVPGFVATKLFSTRLQFERVLDRSEVDILRKTIGFGREEQQYAYQQSSWRGLEFSFYQGDRAEIAEVERFFVDRRGSARNFMAPTWRGDLRLADNLPRPDATRINIETSRFSNPDYAEHPGHAYIALIDSVGVAPHKIVLIDGTELHVANPITRERRMNETIVSHLLLSRFAEAKLTWTYHTDGQAETRLKLIELAGEYANPQIEVPQRARILRITEQLPQPQTRRYTSYEDTRTYAGEIYAPAPFQFGAEKTGLKLDKEQLQLQTWDFPGNPLRKILDDTLEAKLWCEVIDINALAPNDGSAFSVIGGEVKDFSADGKEWTAVIDPFGGFFDLPFPRFYFQKVCNVPVYSQKCGVDREDFRSRGALVGNDNDVTIDLAPISGQPNPTTHVADYFANGFIETGTGANFQRRPIKRSSTLNGKLRLVIVRPLRNAVAQQQVNVWPGNDGSIEMCHARFNNAINHRGHPYIPIRNPSSNFADVQQSAGGKKG